MWPLRTLFPVVNQSIAPCLVLLLLDLHTVSQEAVKQSGTPSLEEISTVVVIHIVKGFSIASEAEVHVFLEFSCLFYDPTDIGNLVSGSSAFFKSSMNIWTFLVYVLLKPSLQDFEHDPANEHDLASMGNECNCAIV